MYYILHNTDNEKVTILKDDSNFIHFMRNIAVENGDEELSITCISEAMDYFENYCDNLTFLVEKPKVTPIYTDPRISYLPPYDDEELNFNDLRNEIINNKETLTYSLDGFVEAFNNAEISDLGYITIKIN
jgi:hypothetical protein